MKLAPDPARQKLQDIERDFRDPQLVTEETLEVHLKSGAIVPYRFGPGPSKMQTAANLQRSRGLPVRLISLKARQVYISTWFAGYFLWLTAFLKGQKAMVVSHEAKSTANIFSYYKFFCESYRPFRGVVKMLPHTILASKIEFAGGGYVDVATANNLKTGRSFSLRHLHLSEYAFYKNASALMAGLMQAVPDDPDTSIGIESSANGVGGDFYQKWLEANDPSSGSAFMAVFMGYWEHPEYTFPVERPADFQQSMTKEEWVEQGKYGLTLGQVYWRRWAIRNRCGGSVDTFRQEFPGNAEEAFLFTGRPRLSHTHISRMPIIADPIVGELETHQNGPKRTIEFVAGEKGAALILYKRPKAGSAYVIGCDIAEGVDAGDGTVGGDDPDYTVCQVFDRDTGEQVAKLRGRIWPSSAGQYCAVLAEWYNWAFIVPERNGPGIAFIDALLRENYPTNLIFHGEPSPEETSGEKVEQTRLGWNTNSVSRVHLISGLDADIRSMALIIHDAHTCQELRTFVIWPNGKAAAQRQCHDDEVIALALASIGIRFAPMDTRLDYMKQMQPDKAKLRPGVQTYGKKRFPTSEDSPHNRGTRFRF